MPVQHSNPQWSRFLNAVRAKEVTITGQNPETVLGQELDNRLQGSVTVDDVSHLAAPLDYAGGAAGCFNRTGLAAGSNSVLELSCPHSVEGLWVLSAGITHASGGTSSGFIVQMLNASEIAANALAMTVSPWGTLAPRATVRTGTIPTPAFPWQAPARAEFGSADLQTPLWVNPGEIFNIRCIVAGTTLYSSSVYWAEVPRVPTP